VPAPRWIPGSYSRRPKARRSTKGDADFALSPPAHLHDPTVSSRPDQLELRRNGRDVVDPQPGAPLRDVPDQALGRKTPRIGHLCANMDVFTRFDPL
jgi:hypothetical protein